MKNKWILVILTCCIIGGLGIACASADKPLTAKAKDGLCVGVFDSRAIVVAFAGSDIHNKELNAKMAERDKAKAAGDDKKVAQLEAWGSARQGKYHRQGFGTAPVDDILIHIKKDLPEIAKAAGVDVIVSKWDVVYKIKGAEVVDITDQIVMPFKPTEKTLKSIKSLMKHKPLTEKELDGMDHLKH